MESQFDEGLLLLLVQSSEDFSGIQQVVVLGDLHRVEDNQWQVQQEREPVSCDQEQER